MQQQDAAGAAARAAMARLAGSTPQSFDAQLTTTHLFAPPAQGVAAAADPALVITMTRVRHFSFSKGLFGPGATSPDAIGMGFPAGKSLGNKGNIKLRFDPAYMQMAADGKL